MNNKTQRPEIFHLEVDCTSFKKGKALGFNTYLMNLLRGMKSLEDRTLKFTLYTQKGERSFDEFLTDKRFSCYAITGKNRWLRLLIINFFFTRSKADAILFPANYHPMFCNKKSFTVIHDLVYLSFPTSLPMNIVIFKKLLSKYLIKKSFQIVSISKFTQTELQNKYNITSKVIYNPVSILQNNKKKYSLKKKRILWLTSLAQHKNVQQSIHALNKFLEIKTDFSVEIVGNWPRNKFDMQALNPRIIVSGFLEGSELQRAWSEASVVFVPSLYEGFGLPYIESAINSIFLVCSDLEVAREVVGSSHSGNISWIKAPYNAASVFNALLNIPENVMEKSYFFNFDLDSFEPTNVASKYIEYIRKKCGN
jgi:glycosyltransferase involved in cell wall biosynthesis